MARRAGLLRGAGRDNRLDLPRPQELLGREPGPVPGTGPARQSPATRPYRRRLLSARRGRHRARARAARNPLPRGLPRVPEASLAPPVVHQHPRRALPPAQLLARPRLAGHRLAPLVVAKTRLGGGARRGPPPGFLEGARRWELRRVLRAPFAGEGLGSDDQAWTAAVALDWLADGA